ncbi:MAG TPA: hypothetical protein DEZ27_01115 [Sphaerochaeta sp.]|nr:hypothetical protein [Sphaerochaeta sp.]
MGQILVFLRDFRKSVTRKEILVLHIEFLIEYFFCAYYINNDNNNEERAFQIAHGADAQY